jgi:serine/threonine-protein kinase
MGEVYEAWDMVLARPVALKILRHLEPAAMVRFMHEAQLHARLDCPNICRIYDVDAANGAPRIAMQLVRGPTLEEASPDLRLDEILAIMIQVADALHAAHQLKLIHRDIKPSNILLQWAEGGWTPFICDFGLAMALDGPTVTQPLAMTGTPAYMAPEQVRGDRSHICPATDVYGVGSTLYFALTGRPPCVSTVTAEVLRVKRERRFPSPRSLEPQIPRDLETIMLKCMQPSPADRYATTAELAEELRRVHQGQTIRTQPQGRWPRARNWAGRNWPFLAAAAAVAGMVLGLGAWERNRQHRLERAATLSQYFTQEAARLEQNLNHERMLPAHDLGPAYAQIRARMEALRDRGGALGPGAEAPLHAALGRAHFALREFPAASAELERAWSQGYRPPEVALLLARLSLKTYRRGTAEAAFTHAPLAPGATAALARAEDLFRQARGLDGDPQEYAEAALAFAQKDYAKAAGLARASLGANPWNLEAARLASLSLSALAMEQLDLGEAPEAETRFNEALATAQASLTRSPSDPGLHQAQAVAAQGLAALALERGNLPLATLEEVERRAAEALLLSPEDPESQSHWLRARCLKAMRMLDLGQDPAADLETGFQFYWTRTREPRAVGLRVDHMMLYFLQARADAAHGRDPGPALTEALKDPGHAVGWPRDAYGDLFNFKARLEAARGQDPRATVASILQAFDPGTGGRDIHLSCEVSAEALLTQAEWEAKAGQAPGPSLQRAQALLQRGLQAEPGSAAAHALLGQAELLEAAAQPAQRAWLLARAREQLQSAQRLHPSEPQTLRLKLKLAP